MKRRPMKPGHWPIPGNPLMADTPLVLASGNPGKLREVQAIFHPHGIEVLSQHDFAVPEVAETGWTFIENALIKARACARASGLASLADDSGLEVDALNGAPGIYSARYCGRHGDDAANRRCLLEALEGIPREQRTARFQCWMVLMRRADDPAPLISSACWEGLISEYEQGNQGFGYDPVFYLPAYQCSAAELTSQQKNNLSHRYQALKAMRHQLEALWKEQPASDS